MLNKYINNQRASTKKFVRVLVDAPPISKKEAEVTAEVIASRRIERARDAFKAGAGVSWSGYWQEIKGFCEPFPDEVTNPTIRDEIKCGEILRRMPAYFKRVADRSGPTSNVFAVYAIVECVEKRRVIIDDVMRWLSARYSVVKDDRGIISDLSPLRLGARVSAPQTADELDEVAARLLEEMPWQQRAISALWKASRERAGGACPMPPIIFHGPPGWGKSTLARRFAQLCGRPHVVLDAASAGASHRIAGTEKGWSTASPGVPVETILRTRCADPLFVIDEIDKAASARSEGGSLSSLSHALLPLLEPGTAAAWQCPFYRASFDMRRISWILTANEIGLVPAPLRDRCLVIHCPRPDAQGLQAAAVAMARVAGVDDPDDVGMALCGALEGSEMTLRGLSAVIARLKSSSQAPNLH